MRFFQQKKLAIKTSGTNAFCAAWGRGDSFALGANETM
jgi:hypothetical protein